MDYTILRQLILEKGHKAQEPLSVRQVKRLGLRRALDILAGNYRVPAERIIKNAGFTTYREANYYDNSEQGLRRRLLAYNNGSMTNPIKVHAMHRDKKGGGGSLSGALAEFAKKRFGKCTATLTINHLGFRIHSPRHDDDSIMEELRKYWPENAVRSVYEGTGTLNTTENLLHDNPRLYSAAKRHGAERLINSLYPGFPDLYSCVSYRGQADPCIVRRQLLDRFFSGRSISQGLKTSPDPNDNLLHKRVISLQPRYFKGEFRHTTLPYMEIVKELVPELRPDDIRCQNIGTLHRNGEIGNLIVEWLLRWTKAIESTGGFYRDGFAKTFAAPIEQIHSEKQITAGTQIVRPDLFVVGGSNTVVEIKTGQNLQNPSSLADKYKPRQDYVWNIGGRDYSLERLVAVLHMPERVTSAVKGELENAEYCVTDADKFLSWLEIFIEKISQHPWHNHFAEAAPRMHDPRSITEFYKLLAFKPALFTRRAHNEEAEFVRANLESLSAHELPSQGI